MKIFCIGFNKTGTISLYNALNRLGYAGIHGLWENHLKVGKAIQEQKPLLSYFSENIVHFSDLDIIKDNYKLLDEQYPNSKFILNTRKKQDWLQSRTTHYEDYLRNMHTNKYAKTWEWVTKSKEQWAKEWDKHHLNVVDYFAGRSDLIVLDIPAGHGYERLCKFLDIPVINEEFPRLNVTKNKKNI
jgi:hypothetical protein